VGTYRSKEIQRLIKVSNKQLTHWSSKGAISPLEDAEGRGKRRLYSWQNLIEAMICRELSRYVVEVDFMKHMLEHIRKEPISIWRLLKKDPKPNNLFILVSADAEGYESATVWEGSDDPEVGSAFQEVADFVATYSNTVAINVKRLLDEEAGF